MFQHYCQRRFEGPTARLIIAQPAGLGYRCGNPCGLKARVINCVMRVFDDASLQPAQIIKSLTPSPAGWAIMTRAVGPFLLCLCLCLCASTFAAAAPENKNAVVLCDNGRPACVIAHADNASPIEKLAATEIAKYLENITGATYETAAESATPVPKDIKTIIHVYTKDTPGQMANSLKAADYSKLKETGYLIRTLQKNGQNHIIITGLTAKGVLNGAYGFIEDILRRESGRKFADIDFTLENKLPNLAIPAALAITDNPYSSVSGMELDGFGLDNKTLLNPATRQYVTERWHELVDWCRRHKVNFICNWPYGGESMNDFPNIVLLDKNKYPLPVSAFSDEDIKRAALVRRELLKYASDNGVDPYLMTYVPGWHTTTIKKNYPQFCGVGSHGDADGFGSKAFNWADKGVHAFLADLAKAVVEQYPEAKGVHFRVWGGESAPDTANLSRKTELLQVMIKGMVAAAVHARKDIKFILSEYSEYGDNNLTFLPQLRALSPNIIIHRKWDKDWGVSNDPRIPAKPAWLNTNDGVKRGVSHSVPYEEPIPFWFPTVKFYQEGLLKYLKPGEETINGWPVNYRDWHTKNCDNVLNLLGMMKLAWNPFDFDYKQYYKDSYYFLFGAAASEKIARASELQSEALCDFCYDYGSIIDGMNSGNWFNLTKNLIGKPADSKNNRYIAHILDKEKRPGDLKRIKARIEHVLPKQQQAVDLLESVNGSVTKNREIFDNMLNVNRAWLQLLKSRLAAVNATLAAPGSDERKHYVDEFLACDDALAGHAAKLTNVMAQSQFDDTEAIKAGLIRQIREEQDYVRGWLAGKGAKQ